MKPVHWTQRDTESPSLAARIVKAFSMVLLVLVVLFVLAMIGLEFLLVLPLTFLFGWMLFLRDVLPQLTWNWELIATGVICLAIFFWGFHRTAKWFRPDTSPAEVGWRWRWRWTVTVTLGVMLFFTATISVIGVLHQTIWLAKTDEPMLRSNFRQGRVRVINDVDIFIATEVVRKKVDPDHVTGNFIRAEIPRFIRQSGTPNLRITVLSGPEDRLTGLILDRRQRQSGSEKSFGLEAYCWDGTKMRFTLVVSDPAELPAFIADAQAGRLLEKFTVEPAP